MNIINSNVLHTYISSDFFFFLNMEQSIKLLYIVLNKLLVNHVKNYLLYTTKYTRLLYSIAIVMLDASSDEQIILQKSKAGAIVFMKMEIKKKLKARRRKK